MYSADRSPKTRDAPTSSMYFRLHVHPPKVSYHITEKPKPPKAGPSQCRQKKSMHRMQETTKRSEITTHNPSSPKHNQQDKNKHRGNITQEGKQTRQVLDNAPSNDLQAPNNSKRTSQESSALPGAVSNNYHTKGSTGKKGITRRLHPRGMWAENIKTVEGRMSGSKVEKNPGQDRWIVEPENRNGAVANQKKKNLCPKR